MVDFDVETNGLQPWSGNEAFLWIFYDGTTAEAILFNPSEYRQIKAEHGVLGLPNRILEAWERIQEWFRRGMDEGIRAWNAKFDRAFAETACCFEVPGDGLWYDGMIEAHTMDERRSVALKAVASQLFGEEAADPQKKLKEWLNEENRRRRKAAREDNEEYEPANYSHVPMTIMEPYGLEDVISTRRVCAAYAPRLAQAPDLAKSVEFERQAMDALYAVEKRGLPADEPGYRKLEIEVIENLERLEERVRGLANEADPIVYGKELAGKKRWKKGEHWIEQDKNGRIIAFEGGVARLEDFNPKSTPQILAALKARGADLSHMSEKNGKVGADAENLRAVDDELAVAILEFRSEFKVLSTYVRPMIGRSYVASMNTYKEPFIASDGRIHATYRQVGARTGRMSCADPNMQNQPRDDLRLRYNIVAEPGHALVTCDLTNIEMYLFAAFCGPGRLLTAVQNGEDLHTLTAKMLGLRDRKRPGGGVETARQLGKTYNFSRVYGGGLRTIRRQFRCSMDEARLLRRRFDDAYPEVKNLQVRIQHRLETDGYIQDKYISGRRFRVDPKDAYKATNHLVQGTAAALLKWAMIRLHADGVPMVALVHDEIVAHVPQSEAQEAANLIERRMTEFDGFEGIIPLKAEADIVHRWSDAKPLKDEDGRPYLFTPEWDGGKRRYLEAA